MTFSDSGMGWGENFLTLGWDEKFLSMGWDNVFANGMGWDDVFWEWDGTGWGQKKNEWNGIGTIFFDFGMGWASWSMGWDGLKNIFRMGPSRDSTTTFFPSNFGTVPFNSSTKEGHPNSHFGKGKSQMLLHETRLKEFWKVAFTGPETKRTVWLFKARFGLTLKVHGGGYKVFSISWVSVSINNVFILQLNVLLTVLEKTLCVFSLKAVPQWKHCSCLQRDLQPGDVCCF